MEKYYIVTIKQKISVSMEDIVKEVALSQFTSTGIEEFNLEEILVDDILGERSYSGGDIPQEVIDEVESVVKNQIENDSEVQSLKFYFEKDTNASSFQAWLKDEYQIDSILKEENQKDWNNEWRKHYQEILIDEDLKIIPSWEKEKARKSDLLIYPGMGFGTGGHETTFLCLKLMRKYKKETSSCLDFGCGSGILGIATYLENKNNFVDFIDIDDEALLNTKQNLKLNQFEERNYTLINNSNDTPPQKQYDLIFANILQNVLLVNAEYLENMLSENGVLVISGLLVGQEIAVIEKMHSLEVLEVAKKNDWIAVAFRKI